MTDHKTLTSADQERLNAAAFRRLLAHLQDRTDVQNIDLMILADFCRNCLSRWYREAADEAGLDISRKRQGRVSTACSMASGKQST